MPRKGASRSSRVTSLAQSIIAVVLLLSGCGGATEPEAGGDPPRVAFIGRPDRREADSVRMSWSGSGIAFRFLGSEASVILDDPAHFFTVLVDGQEQPTLATTPGEQRYSIASNLEFTTHEARLYRRTEAGFGPTRFLGVELGPSGKLLRFPPVARRLEIIGDSITCGFGDEGPDTLCTFSPATENHYLTYGAITARNLDADLITIAESGKGVGSNYGGNLFETIPVLYERTLPNDESSVWDFGSWQPDAVIINLGTNDFAVVPRPTEEQFGGAYASFVERIRVHYPKAFILCLVPTGLSGTDRDTAELALHKLVAERNDDGDDRIAMRALDYVTRGSGCANHPSLQTHAAMAEALTSELRLLLRW